MKPRPSFPAKLPPAGGRSAVALSPQTVQVNPRPTAGQDVRKGLTSPAPGRSTPLPMTPVSSGLGLDSGAVRARMVAKLAEQGVQDPWVLQAMGQVERHRFVETALAGQAYEDTSLPIGLGQTISKPNVVARMIELLRQDVPGKLGRVLEIGTGRHHHLQHTRGERGQHGTAAGFRACRPVRGRAFKSPCAALVKQLNPGVGAGDADLLSQAIALHGQGAACAVQPLHMREAQAERFSGCMLWCALDLPRRHWV